MDTRHFFQEFLLVLFFISIQPGLSYIEDDYEDPASFGRCPWIRNKLKNGRVRYRYKGRVAKFLCDSGYDLAGKRSSTCVRGQWSNPVPVCVARGCPRVPMISNGHVTEMYRGALLVYDCNPGYTLDGVASIHCDGRRWSTSPPVCVVATENPDMSCDFESAELCGWSHDPNHDFDWKRNQFSTPSGHAGTGPSFDHTFGENKGGYYLYIEASSPRKINDTARLFSPVYAAGMSGGCFVFWYHMYGATTGGLRVYLRPESHVFDELLPKWEKFGDQGNQWNRGNIPIPVLHENFQIVIEGIRGESYVGDSAIDDVSLSTQDCESMENDTATVEHTNSESCRGRCREIRDAESGSSCSCNEYCYYEHNCCSDYLTFCFEGNETTVHNADEPPAVSLVTTTSPITTAAVITISETPEQYASNTSPKSTPKSSAEVSEALTSSTAIQTSSVTNSSTSTISTVTSAVPLNVTRAFTTVLSSSSLPSTTTQSTSTESTSLRPTTTGVTTPFSESVTSQKVVISSSSSMETTKPPETSVETVTSSPVSTAVSSTISSSKTSVLTTFISMNPKKTTSSMKTTPSTSTVSETLPTTQSTSAVSTSLPTTQSTNTVSTNPSTTQSSSTVSTTTGRTPTPELITYLPPITTASSRSPNVTLVVQSTTISSTTVPTSSATTEPSTRKTYNLRPLPHRITPVSSVTPASTNSDNVTGGISDNATVLETTVPSTTRLKYDIETQNTESSTRVRPTLYSIPETTFVVRSTWIRQLSTRFSTTQQAITTSTSRPYIRQSTQRYTPQIYRFTTSHPYIGQTTHRYTPQIYRFTSTEPSISYSATSNSNGMETSESDTSSSSSSVPIVITLLVVIICIAAGVAYYMRKQKNKRQSKLSDDSEMRFLQENDYMEYSDPSVLDRILIK